MKRFFTFFSIIALAVSSCSKPNLENEKLPIMLNPPKLSMELGNVAKLISELPVGAEQFREVFDAVNSSTTNGYDEEYMFEDLLTNPGAGVGDQQTKSGSGYSRPIKDLLKERLLDVQATKGGSAQEVEEYLNNLLKSDIQIYWPYSELWDGKTTPIVTYDPGDGATSNYGYEFIYSSDGVSVTDSILVDEGVAQTRPVWVINRNDDSVYTPLKSLTESPEYKSYVAQAEDSEVRRLTLTTLTMMQHYDSWFGGASEFFVKCAAVDDFHAETEEEMREYSPKITDFMIVVQRNQL
ncbi:MAG: hypothetical protein IIU68_03390, partial [Bacteroidales bacterium]|nr:hypothetical protein [Bacteroidales bacterium]